MSSSQRADPSGETTATVDPVHGAAPRRAAEHRPEAIAAALSRARQAQRDWAAQPIRNRVRSLQPLHRFLVDQADRIAAVIARDTGKTRVEALATEVMPALMALGYACRKAPRFLRPRPQLPGTLLLWHKWSRIVRVPYGVVAVISPWNYPFAIPFAEIVPALLAGNAVLFKGSGQTQGAAEVLDECLASAALPEGLFIRFDLPGAVAGPAFLAAGIDKLFFTGSVTVGQALMQQAAATLTPVSLELGGNDAMLVASDADLDRAARGALWGGLQNCGQSCAGVERIYVHRDVYQPFLERLKNLVERLRVGPDRAFDVDLGALTTLEQKRTVSRHVNDALARGARLFARSPQPQTQPQMQPAELKPEAELESEHDLFYPATVLTEVTDDMLVMREETFGPVLAVARVADMEEAVRRANDSHYGLTASVWSRNPEAAERLGRRLQTGVITVNDHLMSHGMPETPWGGFKHSGIGRTHGRIGFDEMTQAQVIVHDLLAWTKRDLWWHPYSEALYRGLLGAISTFYGAGFWERLRGLPPLARIFPRIFTNRWDSGVGRAWWRRRPSGRWRQ